MPSITENLELYLPDAGQSGVAAQLNNNLTVIDGRFDEASGHTHDGTEGEGPKLPVTSIQAGGTASSSTYLRGDGTWATGTGSGSGVTDHGDLTGLADDDHPQYINQGRGDARYAQRSSNLSDLTNTATARTNLGAAAASHTHAGADITSGTVATARLGSGTANATTYLRGDQTWQPVSGSGGAGTLDDLTDVLIVTPSDNQVLTYDSVGARWVNETPPTPPAGLTTEDVDDRVAALIVAGTGITKTYDDTANTLTLAATGGPTSTEIAFMFTADGSAYYVTTGNCTIALGQEGGTGTLAYAIAPDNSAVFGSSVSLPQSLTTGQTLRVTVSAISTFKAVTLVRT